MCVGLGGYLYGGVAGEFLLIWFQCFSVGTGEGNVYNFTMR